MKSFNVLTRLGLIAGLCVIGYSPLDADAKNSRKDKSVKPASVEAKGDNEATTSSECGECSGGFTSLSLVYNGSDEVVVIISDAVDTYFNGWVEEGDVITVNGTRDNGRFQRMNVDFFVDGEFDTRIHVSCSVDVNLGDVYGSFTVVGGVSRNGGSLACDSEPPEDPEDPEDPSLICGDPEFVRLLAGQHTHAGDVIVATSEGYLYITYLTQDGWLLTETHLSIGTSLSDIPANNGGGIPGQFQYTGTHDYETMVVYSVPLAQFGDASSLYIAAHAVVKNNTGSTWREETGWGEGERLGRNWSMYFTYDVEECEDEDEVLPDS